MNLVETWTIKESIQWTGAQSHCGDKTNPNWYLKATLVTHRSVLFIKVNGNKQQVGQRNEGVTEAALCRAGGVNTDQKCTISSSWSLPSWTPDNDGFPPVCGRGLNTRRCRYPSFPASTWGVKAEWGMLKFTKIFSQGVNHGILNK